MITSSHALYDNTFSFCESAHAIDTGMPFEILPLFDIAFSVIFCAITLSSTVKTPSETVINLLSFLIIPLSSYTAHTTSSDVKVFVTSTPSFAAVYEYVALFPAFTVAGPVIFKVSNFSSSVWTALILTCLVPINVLSPNVAVARTVTVCEGASISADNIPPVEIVTLSVTGFVFASSYTEQETEYLVYSSP